MRGVFLARLPLPGSSSTRYGRRVAQLAPAGPKQRLQSIDFLRGVASFSVLVFHALLSSPLPAGLPGWVRLVLPIPMQGYLGVPLFFVISGFCIHLPRARAEACERA